MTDCLLEHTVDAEVSAAFAWAFWTNVANWDDPPAQFSLDGPFADGARGTTVLPGQAPIRWRVRNVYAGRAATIEMELDRATLAFEWHIDPVADRSTRLTQRLVLSGENASALAASIREAFAPNLAAGMARLAAAMVRRAQSTVDVRAAMRADAGDWLRMRCALWPEGDEPGHAAEIERFFAGVLRTPLAVLLAVDDVGSVVGFAELSIRSYAEDCTTDRVAYLEGWYVEPHARRRGVGRALVQAAEAWARSQGCVEFGSDALVSNEASAAAHRALGFAETAQIRCFLKPLS